MTNKPQALWIESRNEHSYLFGLYFSALYIGNGLLPLVPNRALSIGLKPLQIGLVMASMFATLALGSLVSSKIFQALKSTRFTLIATQCIRLVGLPLLASSSLYAFFAGGVFCWLSFGVELCILKVHANATSDPVNRGNQLGKLERATPLATVLGGLLLGLASNSFGFSIPTVSCCALCLFSIFCALKLANVSYSPPQSQSDNSTQFRFHRTFAIFAILNFIGVSGGLLARASTPILMNAKQFAFGAPAIVSAIGALACLPLTALMGRWSDKVGRSVVLGFSLFGLALGILCLAFANSLVLFAFSSFLVSVFLYAANGVRAALIGDLAKPSELPRATSIFDTIGWCGGIAGFGLSGWVAGSQEHLGIPLVSAIVFLSAFAMVYAGKSKC